jgi:hypothetical protein
MELDRGVRALIVAAAIAVTAVVTATAATGQEAKPTL